MRGWPWSVKLVVAIPVWPWVFLWVVQPFSESVVGVAGQGEVGDVGASVLVQVTW